MTSPWPDAHGCRDPRDHREYIELRREEAIAALSPRQRIARHWAWWWSAYVVAAICLLFAVLALLAWQRILA